MAVIQPVFTTIRGMATDPPFDQLQPGFMRRVLDALPGDSLAPVQIRAGWRYGTGVLSGPQPIDWLTWAPFPGAEKVVSYAAGDSRAEYVLDLGGFTTGAAIGTTALPCVTAPFFHRIPTGGLMIYPGGGGSSVVQKWAGSGALANLGGSPPKADRGVSWGDYLILAGDLNPGKPQANRAWFSAVGNPESWDLLNAYVDIPEDIVAVVPKGNSIYFFGAKGTHIMVGDLPPPGGNMTLKKYIFSQGLSDPDAVATYKDYVIWGNANGIFRSDGSQPADLTSLAGVSSYWPFSYSPIEGDKLNLGCYRQYLIVNILTETNVFKRCLVFDLEQTTAWEWANIAGRHLLRIPSWSGGSEDLLFPLGRRICRVAPIFDGINDEDEDESVPQLEIVTGGLRLGMMGQKRLRRSWLTLTGRSAALGQDYAALGASYANYAAVKAGYADYEATLQAFASSIQAYASVDSAIGLDRNPAGDPPNLFSIGSLVPSETNRIVRIPLRVHRKAELIRFQIKGRRSVRLYGLEQEIAGYDAVRDGDPHA